MGPTGVGLTRSAVFAMFLLLLQEVQNKATSRMLNKGIRLFFLIFIILKKHRDTEKQSFLYLLSQCLSISVLSNHNSTFYTLHSTLYTLHSNMLYVSHHAQPVATPYLLNVALTIAAAEQLLGKLYHLTAVGQSLHTTISIEVGA